MVEFAIVLPLFILLLFGIMEAGWMFAQQVEMRNATREGARLAVVDYGTGEAVIDETCSRADLSGAGTTMSVTINTDSVTIDATKTYASLTGFIDAFVALPMSASTEMRTERTLDVLTNFTKVCP
jgi:Flp pilus assembly protein TadG